MHVASARRATERPAGARLLINWGGGRSLKAQSGDEPSTDYSIALTFKRRLQLGNIAPGKPTRRPLKASAAQQSANARYCRVYTGRRQAGTGIGDFLMRVADDRKPMHRPA
jgi:hypothetical protein